MAFYYLSNLRNKFSKNSGFSLVEVMIAAAALGGLAVVGMQMTKTMAKSNVKTSFDSETILITNEIVAILSDPNKCLVTLGGKNAISTTTGINKINGSKYYSAASGNAPANGYGNAGLSIASYAISATASEVSANNSSLLINYQNKNILKGSAGLSTITKKINLYVEVDGSNNITMCRSLSSSSADIWTRGSGGSIYYGGGNVGIGTTGPVTTLDIAGGIKPGDQLQVTLCDATTEGTQRYNKTAHVMEYCGASGAPLVYNWKQMGGFNSTYVKYSSASSPIPVPSVGKQVFCESGDFAISGGSDCAVANGAAAAVATFMNKPTFNSAGPGYGSSPLGWEGTCGTTYLNGSGYAPVMLTLYVVCGKK